MHVRCFMRRFIKTSLVSAVMVGIGVSVYTYLLTPEAKQSLKNNLKNVVLTTQNLSEQIASRLKKSSQIDLQTHQDHIEQQWEELGF